MPAEQAQHCSRRFVGGVGSSCWWKCCVSESGGRSRVYPGATWNSRQWEGRRGRGQSRRKRPATGKDPESEEAAAGGLESVFRCTSAPHTCASPSGQVALLLLKSRERGMGKRGRVCPLTPKAFRRIWTQDRHWESLKGKVMWGQWTLRGPGNLSFLLDFAFLTLALKMTVL